MGNVLFIVYTVCMRAYLLIQTYHHIEVDNISLFAS